MEDVPANEIPGEIDPMNQEAAHIDIVTDFEAGSQRLPEDVREKLMERQRAVAAARRRGESALTRLGLRY